MRVPLARLPAPPPPPRRALPRQARIPRPRHFWKIAGGLSLLCLILRVIHLLALPLFGDEAIYLRWAQVIRGEGLSPAVGGIHLWVSLADPKPPLHFWLIAVVFHWASDPLVAARLLSVLAGVACVPLMMLLGGEFGRLMTPREKQIGGTGLGVIAAGLGIFCPFLAFYQRLATADALFIAESLLIVWLSLRWARLACDMPRRGGWLAALGLGAAIGAGLLTRQGVSYTLCAFPAAAWAVNAWSRRKAARATLPADQRANSRESFLRLFARSAAQLATAGVVAAVLWAPYLTAELNQRALDQRTKEKPGIAVSTDELLAEVKRRIFYQASFTHAPDSRTAMMRRNLFVTFLPGWNDNQQWNSGWMPLYMTPLVFIVCLAGVVYAAIRQRRLALLLALWLVLLLGPIVLLADTLYSRYVLVGVPPLLFFGACLLGDTLVLLVRPRPKKIRAIVGTSTAVLLGGIVLSLPALELGRQAFAWQSQTLVEGGDRSYDVFFASEHSFDHHWFRSDRYQYLTGWTSGTATAGAIKYLQDTARAHPDKPVIIITTDAWGLPADSVWVYLSQEKNVHLYFTDNRTILRPGKTAGTCLLRADKWLFAPEQEVPIPPGASIFFVTADPLNPDTKIPAFMLFKQKNPNLRPPKTFYGIEGRKASGAGNAVSVFAVPRQ